MEIREKCPEIAGTKLWTYLEQKAENNHSFLTAVMQVCDYGVKQSKGIISFFPKFTLHDSVHITNVCWWMARLLGNQLQNLTEQEAALLLMSACCHDIGMSVSEAEEKALLSGSAETPGWVEYFNNHPSDKLAFLQAGKAAGMERGGILTPEILRNYIRANHHKRVEEKLRNVTAESREALRSAGITMNLLANLCRSHGEPLKDLRVSTSDDSFDLRMCAIILRLADLLDFDASRAPDALYRHLGLDRAVTLEERFSAAEWAKNRAGIFSSIEESTLYFTAGFDTLQQEKETQAYLDYVQDELQESFRNLHRYSRRWKDLPLPYYISTEKADRRGYTSGNFRLTMDQDKVIRLLTGKKLYADAGVFVRELLQNAIDAVLYRATIDSRFKVKDGHIVIRTWIDNNGESWFRIEDNGIGMNEQIIRNYFLTVGRSYYTSDEFQVEKFTYGVEAKDGRQEDYTPISRFGIGFLSCFMSDPEYNQVKVSTKRYAQDRGHPNPGIRLDVTGLNGYYYLAVEGKQSEYDESFSPMPHPDDADRGYRTEPGTTICVRADLYRMGGYRSFREIVDKYLCFPRFKVEYFGPEGSKVYPTEQELMEALHKANPDGPDHEPKGHLHPIPDEVFEELKAKMPDTVWHEKPSICLQYYPLDWYSDSGLISGFVIKMSLEANASTEPLIIDGKEYDSKLYLRLYSPDEMSKAFFGIGYESNEINYKDVSMHDDLLFKWQRMTNGVQFYLGHNVLFAWIQSDLSTFGTFITQTLHSTFCGSIAYNNVLAGSEPLEVRHSRSFLYLLLSGRYVPDVEMDRSFVHKLPFEAECELAVIGGKTDLEREFCYLNDHRTTGEKYLSQLEINPTWKDILKISNSDGSTLSLTEVTSAFSCDRQRTFFFDLLPVLDISSKELFYQSVYHLLALTAIQLLYRVTFDFKVLMTSHSVGK